ncbi:MAG: hypothetical protein JWO86_9046 [Myxococcaceae bacterium]|nr:hypothetical protein [Myxococcaceae bacterium]
MRRDWCRRDPRLTLGPVLTRSRTFTSVVLASLAMGLSACERGCLTRWFEDRSASPGAGGEGPRGSAARDGAPSFELGGTDCSDGLARCTEGRVETSVAGHVPSPCTAPREHPGSCECAWSPAGTCATGCLKDGLEVVAVAEVARVQLCAATPPDLLLRPLSPTELASVPICAGEGVSCVDGVVRACTARGQPAQALGACVHGCAAGIGVEPGDLLTGDGPAAILCRHAHAERR